MNDDKTLIILKPDCVAKSLAGEVLRRFEAAGFRLRAMKMTTLSKELLEEHYAHLKEKSFFPEILAFMMSGPVVLLVLSGEDVVTKVRELVGPTDSRKADKGTVRGDFGVDVMVNVVHASDSPENAAIEVTRFFQDSEIFAISTPIESSGR